MPTDYVSAHIDTPVGFLEVRGTSEGISTIAFLEKQPEKLESSDVLSECIFQLQEYFDGKRKDFHDFPLRFAATQFQEEVWSELMNVPFGEVISYGELAERAGHKGAARAVGTAMNVNPLPIIIPCHRVLPADKSLGEYAFGAGKKMWLLHHESITLL